MKIKSTMMFTINQLRLQVIETFSRTSRKIQMRTY